jgi:hypothetical protein
MHLTRQALCRRTTDRLALTQPGHGIMRRSGEAMSFLLYAGPHGKFAADAAAGRAASRERDIPLLYLKAGYLI